MHRWLLPVHWTVEDARHASSLLQTLVDELLDDFQRQIHDRERQALEDRRQLVLPLLPGAPRPTAPRHAPAASPPVERDDGHGP